VHALGINYAQASGNRQALFDKTLAKRLQPAFAARSALWATGLAQCGLTGPPQALEGDAGLFRVYLDAEPPPPDEITAATGIHAIERVSVKRFPSCGAAHAVTQAALDLASEHDLQAADIDEVAVYLGGGPNSLVGMPFRLGRNPQVNAQFSAAYGAALGLLRRRAGLAEFRDAQVRSDTAVAELAARTRLLTHMDRPPAAERIDDDWPAHVDVPHVVTVRTRDGRILQRDCTLRHVLEPGNTNWDRVVAKFRQCAAFAGVDAAGTDALIASVAGLDELENIAGFAAVTVLPPAG
jgi:2-methylcitrate dehydratase PrpD